MLNKLKQEQLTRKRLVTKKLGSTHLCIQHNNFINFASNDYLGLAHDQRIIQTLAETAKLSGFGSTSSPSICGYSKEHQTLEEQCAKLVSKEAALLFNSGYQANLACISALNHRKSIILADRRIHASLIDGARLSRASLYRLRYTNQFQQQITNHPKQDAFIISETIFSMDGSLCSLPTLKHPQKITTLLDHSHGIGVLTPSELNEADIISFGLGKSIASIGGIIASDKETIETIHQLARNHRYSTALPPAICAATSKAISILQDETWRQTKLFENIHYFIDQASKYELSLENNAITPIKTIILGSNSNTLKAYETLLQQGLFVAAIRPPTVAKHQAKLRISLSTAHDFIQIKKLIRALASIKGFMS